MPIIDLAAIHGTGSIEDCLLDIDIPSVIYFAMAYKVKLLQPAIDFMDRVSDRLRAKVVRTIELLRLF